MYHALNDLKSTYVAGLTEYRGTKDQFVSEFGSVLLKNGGEKELARDMAEPDAEPTVKSTKEVVSKADAVPDGRDSGGAEEEKSPLRPVVAVVAADRTDLRPHRLECAQKEKQAR